MQPTQTDEKRFSTAAFTSFEQASDTKSPKPISPAEVEQSCNAILSCCMDAVRYGGTDPNIIRRLGNRASSSDFVLPGGPIRFPGENDFSWQSQDGSPMGWFSRFWKRFHRV
jgi:hypothetical protein